MVTFSQQPLVFQAAVRSDVGLVRENNEDSAYAHPNLLALADGMGGHACGEVASSVAIHTFAHCNNHTPYDFLQTADHARRILQRMSLADRELATMGTTMVAIHHHEGSFRVSHIGDSRLYTFHDGTLNQITTDHTHVQHLINTGRITTEQAQTHPLRAMLLKSLDDQPGGADPDVINLELSNGDRVLLCSDGLTDYVADEVIVNALRIPDREKAADALVESAKKAGTRDNVSVIVADITRADTPPAQYAGAAQHPITLSPQAAQALQDVDPHYGGPITVTPEPQDDELTPTQVIPQINQASRFTPGGMPYVSENPFPVAPMLAGTAVLVVSTAIFMIL